MSDSEAGLVSYREEILDHGDEFLIECVEAEGGLAGTSPLAQGANMHTGEVPAVSAPLSRLEIAIYRLGIGRTCQTAAPPAAPPEIQYEFADSSIGQLEEGVAKFFTMAKSNKLQDLQQVLSYIINDMVNQSLYLTLEDINFQLLLILAANPYSDSEEILKTILICGPQTGIPRLEIEKTILENTGCLDRLKTTIIKGSKFEEIRS